MAGKHDSGHHSTANFDENILVVETSYQMFEVLFCNQKRAVPPWYDNSAKFPGETKYNDAFWGVYSLTICEKTLNQILSSNLKVSVLSTLAELISNE